MVRCQWKVLAFVMPDGKEPGWQDAASAVEEHFSDDASMNAVSERLSNQVEVSLNDQGVSYLAIAVVCGDCEPLTTDDTCEVGDPYEADDSVLNERVGS